MSDKAKYCESGVVLVTRNLPRIGNNSPGWWNHAAIKYKDWVIEAQQEPGKIIAVRYQKFWERYPIIGAISVTHTAALAMQAASFCVDLLGKPYEARPGFDWDNGQEFNCVSMLRYASLKIFGSDPRWRTPTQIWRRGRVKLHWRKNQDAAEWTQPADWYETQTTDKELVRR